MLMNTIESSICRSPSHKYVSYGGVNAYDIVEEDSKYGINTDDMVEEDSKYEVNTDDMVEEDLGHDTEPGIWLDTLGYDWIIINKIHLNFVFLDGFLLTCLE